MQIPRIPGRAEHPMRWRNYPVTGTKAAPLSGNHHLMMGNPIALSSSAGSPRTSETQSWMPIAQNTVWPELPILPAMQIPSPCLCSPFLWNPKLLSAPQRQTSKLSVCASQHGHAGESPFPPLHHRSSWLLLRSRWPDLSCWDPQSWALWLKIPVIL